jgi:hypothetical protein
MAKDEKNLRQNEKFFSFCSHNEGICLPLRKLILIKLKTVKYLAPGADKVHLQLEGLLAESYRPVVSDVEYLEYDEEVVPNTAGELSIF